jgi:hypothetical protein
VYSNINRFEEEVEVTRGFKGKRFAQFALLAFMAGEVSYVAAEVLVLRAVGPSARRYPAGQRLPDNTSFTLRAGDAVTVLAGGGTRTFRGPGTYSASGPARAGGMASAGPRRNTGAVRGAGDGEVLRPDDVWQVDVTQSGRACVAAGQRPTLWRPVADSAIQLTITPPTGAPQTVSWARGQKTLAWPASVPVADNASYQISWTGAASPKRLTTRTLPAMPTGNLDALATAFITHECRGQLDVLIAKNEAAEASASRNGRN